MVMLQNARDIFNVTIRRAVTSSILIICLLTIVFLLAHLAPGDPLLAMISPTVPPNVVQAVREHFGFDQPLLSQYGSWLRHCLQGDLGVSISYQRPVTDLLSQVLLNTALLAFAAIILEFILGGVLGLIAARYPGSFPDRLISFSTLVLYSVPTFWIGVILLALFSYSLGLLPSSQMFSIGAEHFSVVGWAMDLVQHMMLPALTIAIPGGAAIARYLRANLKMVRGEEYVLFAKSFGISNTQLFLRYELPNTIGPLVTLLGLELGTLLTGALVTETIFAWPGMGRLTVMAIVARDYPLIMGCTIVAGVAVILGNFLADVLHILADPRIRVTG